LQWILIRAAESSDPESDECERFYKPSNYNAGKYYGLSTLRLGVEKSRNAMTVRLANDIGMAPIMDIGERFGIYDDVQPELAWALGAGETTLIRLATAYSQMINGGKKVEPTILDRVQDGTGETIFVHGDVACETCQQDEFLGGPPPVLPDNRLQVIDPVTAYQVTYMMQGVVENGTGGSLRSLGRPLGGKTGTTNDSIDTWFMGFSPDLVVGVYVGVDTPEQLASNIRVGSGTDSLSSFGLTRESDDLSGAYDNSDEPLENLEAASRDIEANDVSIDETENSNGEELLPADVTLPNTDKELPEAKEPTVAEPEVEEIDDGLY